ncbi:hypothetical protein TRIATDRAFT_302407 [Trichoderma atroviride IMI 206040]|uniref:Uncharacterized protein n=1 Tax=Hypocrea atroviridis (strain ATCC 20476 / IMI 206040) TaxID=452589 RepID=G9P6C4_HYPAI|nr:uncharacterized protein TRIATDRAFT_302407 [Trichoderma atroviride IMI 206040]EHK42239.1 hypothetical protein TRIATDRAFT_302407 [Trichoderma atroviride IMI 206040]
MYLPVPAHTSWPGPVAARPGTAAYPSPPRLGCVEHHTNTAQPSQPKQNRSAQTNNCKTLLSHCCPIFAIQPEPSLRHPQQLLLPPPANERHALSRPRGEILRKKKKKTLGENIALLLAPPICASPTLSAPSHDRLFVWGKPPVALLCPSSLCWI